MYIYIIVSSGMAQVIIYRAAQSAHIVAIRHPYAASCMPQTPPFNGKHPSQVDSLRSHVARCTISPVHLSRVIYQRDASRFFSTSSTIAKSKYNSLERIKISIFFDNFIIIHICNILNFSNLLIINFKICYGYYITL